MRILVLTGAGISAESGVPTFRDAGGLWEGHRVTDVATPEGYERDPGLVHRFYDERRRRLRDVQPNAAHLALGRLENLLGDDLLIVTQNIDDLHERGGARRVLHMHGELRSALCWWCERRFPWDEDLGHRPPCPGCGKNRLRPDVVWFGEVPYRLSAIDRFLRGVDVFVSIGTSGAVYPAAGFVRTASAWRARTIEINLVPSEGSRYFRECRYGTAGSLVPAWVDEILAQYRGA